MNPPRFLSIEDVVRLHAIAIADQGGDPALLDRGKLESALAMPMQSAGGEFVHSGLQAMAAAYAFHLCQNHAFADGNKRVALAASLAFLLDNGYTLNAEHDELEQVFLCLAASRLSKIELTAWFHTHAAPRSGKQ